uniref:Protein YIP n=1 Tax=Pyramimonas obovata TaxID=1411642 RepID=A0A7S0N2Q3_9CHLO|mmetsp:Transcript_17632/g.38466  ORF Transcript_17632/g.38466 Transcript_17632/m.38466 type:complete len:230 (+) Transcript_17632:149-838(+)|eukprot:CAMPEP_0118943854 /NCGR_PEP_ID=MMETSP1169-20130426/39174_1 /TAXON_ID=36882 /ORGANISM="Pyramimonas obovata, Strain CCMP722" /LENGTH=229 /DNA_ID=CAMNT_0006889209 /DNA_START=55 /DNA_END=744 /DNA_ORIENTATION=+
MTEEVRPGDFSQDLDQVFQGATTTPVPLSDNGAYTATGMFSGVSAGLESMAQATLGSTLDEEVYVTLMRDVRRVADNVKAVLAPNRGGGKNVLRDWDLWGPFLFVLILATVLSVGAEKPSTVFTVVFTLLCVGALVLNLNVVLLGGKIVFFQSLSLIGYCIFPLDVAAILSKVSSSPFYRIPVLLLGVAWAFYAAVPFIGDSVPPNRQALAVYPVVLLFLTLAWLTLMG